MKKDASGEKSGEGMKRLDIAWKFYYLRHVASPFVGDDDWFYNTKRDFDIMDGIQEAIAYQRNVRDSLKVGE